MAGSRARRRRERQRRHTGTSVETIVARDPVGGAARLTAELDAADASPALLALAAQTASVLRRERGELELALQVAAAGRGRTRRLGTEEALAAFALGRDEIVDRCIERDPALAPIFMPLACAARGDAVASAPRGSTKGVRALHALGRAVRSLDPHTTGPQARFPAARELAPLGPHVAAGLQLARTLLAPSRRAAVRDVLRHRGALRSPHLGPALLGAFAEAEPDLTNEFTRYLEQGRRAREAVAEGLRHATGGPNGRVLAFDLIALLGRDILPADQLANAALHEAFRKMTVLDERGASACLHEATAAGADLVEVARGEAMFAKVKDDDAAYLVSSRRLRRLLSRLPVAEPFELIVHRDIAVTTHVAGEEVAALTEARALRQRLDERAVAGAEDAIVKWLDLMDVERVLAVDSAVARTRYESLVAQWPSFVEGWESYLAFLTSFGDPNEIANGIERAARATNSSAFVAAAADIRRARPVVLGGPEPVGPGPLARLCLQQHASDSAVAVVPADIAAEAERLGARDRLAFDAAIVVGVGSIDPPDAKHYLEERLAASCFEPHTCEQLLLASLTTDIDVESTIERLSLDGILSTDALERLVRAMASVDYGRAGLLAVRLAAPRSRSLVTRITRAAVEASLGHTLLQQCVGSLDARLDNVVSLRALAEQGLDAVLGESALGFPTASSGDGSRPGLVEVEDEDEDDGDYVGQLVEILCDLFGVPPSAAEGLSFMEVAIRVVRVVDTMTRGPSEPAMRELETLFREMFIASGAPVPRQLGGRTHGAPGRLPGGGRKKKRKRPKGKARR